MLKNLNKIKIKMQIKINFKSNIYFVLPHYTHGPMNWSLQDFQRLWQ